MTDEPRLLQNRGHVGMCFWAKSQMQKSPEARNHFQQETLVQMMGRLHLPPIISTGFLYVMDATGQRHMLTMDMAHSFNVCSCTRYNMILILHLLKLPAI
jgi:hypothetical protein